MPGLAVDSHLYSACYGGLHNLSEFGKFQLPASLDYDESEDKRSNWTPGRLSCFESHDRIQKNLQ